MRTLKTLEEMEKEEREEWVAAEILASLSRIEGLLTRIATDVAFAQDRFPYAAWKDAVSVTGG